MVKNIQNWFGEREDLTLPARGVSRRMSRSMIIVALKISPYRPTSIEMTIYVVATSRKITPDRKARFDETMQQSRLEHHRQTLKRRWFCRQETSSAIIFGRDAAKEDLQPAMDVAAVFVVPHIPAPWGNACADRTPNLYFDLLSLQVRVRQHLKVGYNLPLMSTVSPDQIGSPSMPNVSVHQIWSGLC